MREFNNDIDLPEKITQIHIQSLPDFDIADYDLSNPKELERYFKNIERICRRTNTYKKLINFLREEVNMVKCAFYENVNNIDTYSIKIHIHHTPLTLYDIVTTVYTKRLTNQESITELMVAKEVMWIHYNLWLGLVPLAETVHELVHRGQLFIPTTHVYGLYKKFVEYYGLYMDPNLKQNLYELELASQSYDYAKQSRILEVSPVYIDPSGAYDFPDTQAIAKILQDGVNKLDKGVIEGQFNIKDKNTFVKKAVNE